MKMFKLDCYGDTTGPIELEDELEVYYGEIGCQWIDIVTRFIDGVEFDIICDDEGLMKPNCRITAFSSENEPMLVGNLLFAHHDDEGNMTELTDDDIALINSHVRRVLTRATMQYQAVFGVNYS